MRRWEPSSQSRTSAQLAVVVIAHGRAVSAGVVDVDQVADVDLGKHPVDGELIVILAQAADHVILVVAGSILLAQHGDVMVGAVHGRAHQVGCTGVQTDVLLIDVLLVDGRCHQCAVGAGGEAAHLGEDGHIAHPGGDEDLLKLLADALADGHDAVFGLLHDAGETAEYGIVFHKINHVFGFSLAKVDAANFEFLRPFRRDAQYGPADPAETIDAKLDSHCRDILRYK